MWFGTTRTGTADSVKIFGKNTQKFLSLDASRPAGPIANVRAHRVRRDLFMRMIVASLDAIAGIMGAIRGKQPSILGANPRSFLRRQGQTFETCGAPQLIEIFNMIFSFEVLREVSA